jgi:hypothetical protein
MNRAFKVKLPSEKDTAIAGDLMQLYEIFPAPIERSPG